MPTRPISFAPEEYYHLYGRGGQKRTIFYDDQDHHRFLFLILFLQSDFINSKEDNLSRRASQFVRHLVRHPMSNITPEEVSKIVKKRSVELTSFCFMPNHFHLIIKELAEGGISRYMQRVLNAYTKYFNAKYKTSGHLFQGPFQAVHVASNDQLLHLSAYIHRNPRGLKGWRDKEADYQWSSYQDYIGHNRWGELLTQEIVLDQFTTQQEYDKFLRSSSAKTDQLDEEHYLLEE
jgi:putative transposase